MAVCSMQGSELELTDNMTTAEVTTDVRPAQFKWGKRFVWGAVGLGLVTLSAIIAWIIGCYGTAAPEPGASFDNNTSNFIVGGQDAMEGRWPFMLSVQVYGTAAPSHFCGGSLINRRWVLSAAHCFDVHLPEDVSIVLGRRRLMAAPIGVAHRVSQILTHPVEDLALLQLTAPVVYTSKINRVCLAATGSYFPQGTPSWVLGWGRISTDVFLPPPKVLQELKVPVVRNLVCRQYAPSNTDTKICAGGFPEGGTGICRGDSGGPLFHKFGKYWVQSGVINFSSWPCVLPYWPIVCARVDKFEDWIRSIVKRDMCFIRFTVPGADSSSTRTGLPAAVGSVPQEADLGPWYLEDSVEE